MNGWVIFVVIIGILFFTFLLTTLLYKVFFKRFWDIVLSGVAILCLSPILILLTFIGAVAFKGNPFFIQDRPGKHEKIFKLVKFRSMNNKKDETGNYLPDKQRIGRYGKILRATSLDELPELFNIFIGNMSIVGPRPLLIKYLPYYSEYQHHRHDVRPGLTGYAQAHGRNSINWDEKFEMDVWYTKNISLFTDLMIIFKTIVVVFRREGINQEGNATMEGFITYLERKKNNE